MIRWFPLVCYGLLLSACSHVSPVTLNEVLNHRQCQGASPGLTQVTLAEVARLRGSRLLPVPGSTAGSSAAGQAAAAPEQLLIAISRGPQPTPGYAFELRGGRQRGTELILELTWHQPPEDTVLPQVLTHPCVVVGIDGAGVQTVRARDDQGEIGALTIAP